MDRADLLEEYERRRAEAARHGSRAPVAKVYSVVLDELRQLDGISDPARLITTGQASDILGVSPKTVRRWIEDGRLPGAEKTSEKGEWRIPVYDVYRAVGAEPEPTTSRPKLWEPDE